MIYSPSKRSSIPIEVLTFFRHKMQKQLLRSLAESGRSTVFEILYNTKIKRKVSLCAVVLQNVKDHSEYQQLLSRGYSLATAAEKTGNSDASKYFLHLCI